MFVSTKSIWCWGSVWRFQQPYSRLAKWYRLQAWPKVRKMTIISVAMPNRNDSSVVSKKVGGYWLSDMNRVGTLRWLVLKDVQAKINVCIACLFASQLNILNYFLPVCYQGDHMSSWNKLRNQKFVWKPRESGLPRNGSLRKWLASPICFSHLFHPAASIAAGQKTKPPSLNR